jgi:hypothetical protein
VNVPKLIVLQLNELNFDVLRSYLGHHELPAFDRMLRTFRHMETFAEDRYEHLEPWIQWVSAHTGKTYREHGVLRLGDIVNTELEQVFEVLERRGLRVGALSPMNAANRLRNPAYFVPDPWTRTTSDASGYSRRLAAMLRQAVNDNAQSRIKLSSLLVLAEAVIRTLNPLRTARLISSALRSLRKPWMRAMVLDQLIHMIHLDLLRNRRPEVSFVFFNAGAHIQHHYLLNSSAVNSNHQNPEWYVDSRSDPVLDMLKIYDGVLGDYLDLVDQGVRVIVATGLSQLPYDRLKFYYRLKDHEAFLRSLNVRFAQVLPRMTRDFEIVFSEEAFAVEACALLKSVRMEKDGEAVFGDIENRSGSLFVTMTYPHEIQTTDTAVWSGGLIQKFGSEVAFVAVKNGMHSTKGYLYLSPGITAVEPMAPVHISRLFDITLEAAT